MMEQLGCPRPVSRRRNWLMVVAASGRTEKLYRGDLTLSPVRSSLPNGKLDAGLWRACGKLVDDRGCRRADGETLSWRFNFIGRPRAVLRKQNSRMDGADGRAIW